MQPIVNVRSPICIWLMSISIGKHEPSLRQPTVSVGSAGMSLAVSRLQRARAGSEKSSWWLGATMSSSGWPITSSSR